ncbi:MAG: ATP-dependent sacrificial sulfur transferase LarE [Acutalibacteraceae bacterium]|jgi:uncharacterized protein
MTTQEKYRALRDNLQALGRVAVAFSGGVDSTFLLAVAHDTLGDNALAVTGKSPSLPGRERRQAEEFCREKGIRQLELDTDEMALPEYVRNAPDRCYHCKKRLFTAIRELAAGQGACVAEGSNADDEGDYRPGLRAIAELGIHSPLREVGLTKAEIRDLSRRMGLPTWDKPSFACLASRFPYGQPITVEKLGMVERAEQVLLDLGLRQVRVRLHGDMARIEILPEEFDRFLPHREEVARAFAAIGFAYTALDLTGYRSGSMNETLR